MSTRSYGGIAVSSAGYLTKASSPYVSSSSKVERNPFGPSMVQEIFGVHNNSMDDCEGMPEAFYGGGVSEVDEADLFDGELQSYHYRYQGHLDLETKEELEARMRASLQMWDRMYRRISVAALKWHYLVEEAETNPQVMKMFKDLQLIRKLGGSNCV